MTLISTLIALLVAETRPQDQPTERDRGQATSEYALVILGAALVGVLLIGWATAGGGAAAIGSLFDRAVQSVIDQL